MFAAKSTRGYQTEFVHTLTHALPFFKFCREVHLSGFEPRHCHVESDDLLGRRPDTGLSVVAIRSQIEVHITCKHLSLNPRDEASLLAADLDAYRLRAPLLSQAE